ncbi:Oidioi.mRNA.OKI2018_I69.chr1.g2779.t1.cds [Oikopleura dioica]|uniref:Oidioi.mRNA.OKI2018_I69.chr1.g2779.t1.cds n=1 Tax=Oikopleura dioica TaxID=34765 RepID=A0ABN7SW13_OIKDI|nr:Oidioi.mRNA.OKI2018_I69.chr1.g2779.t1.cds [Oikopleura dioica]
MGVITRFFKCENKNCATKPEWNNDDHQLEQQLCKDCNKLTKYFKYECEGMLYGKYQCHGKCTNQWTSAAAVEGSWQQCLRCRKKVTPYYLREHDRKEDEDEKLEEGKAIQSKDRAHEQSKCGECLRLATQKAFKQTCVEYWRMKADPEKERRAQERADKKRPMIKAEMKKKQESHVDFVKSFTEAAESSILKESDENPAEVKAEKPNKKKKRNKRKKTKKESDIKTEPVDQSQQANSDDKKGEVKDEQQVEVKTEPQAEKAPKKNKKKTTKKSKNVAPEAGDNNNNGSPEADQAKTNESAEPAKKPKKKRNRKKSPKKESGDNKENVLAPNEAADDITDKMAGMAVSSPQKATRTSTSTRRVLSSSAPEIKPNDQE